MKSVKRLEASGRGVTALVEGEVVEIVFTCSQCGCTPDDAEQARIETDLARYDRVPTGWTCMKCVPDLALVTSGLNWAVVNIVGHSSRHA